MTRGWWAIAGACATALPFLARCSGDDTSACDACADVVPTPLTVALTPQEVWVHPNAAQPITVALARGPGGSGDVAVTIESDAGMTSDTLVIPANSSSGTLVIHAPSTFPQGTTNIVVDARTSSTLAQATLIVHVAGASGAPDLSFGGGTVDLTPSQGQDHASAMIVLQSGVLVGSTHVEGDDASTVSTIKVLRLAQNGSVDGAFATTSATPDVMSELRSLAMFSNGSIYAVGDVRSPKASFAAVRVLANGGLDPAYAVMTPITLGDDLAFAGGIEPGGDLVAAGSIGDASGIGVARYTQVPLPPPDAGSDANTDADAATDADLDADAIAITSHLDPKFADGGVLSLALSKPSAGASTLLVAPDGSLYVLGFQKDSTTADVAFLHVTSAGAVDQTVTLPLTSGQNGAASALLQPDQTILVASDDGGQALVMRLLSNGMLDGAFATSGRASLSFGSSSAAHAIARDPATGKIIIGGQTGTECLVARLSPSGALDSSFANAGSLAIAQGDSCDIVAIGIDDNGLIVVLENFVSAGVNHIAVARYWP